MGTPHLLRAFALALCIIVAACATAPRLAPPKVTVARVSVDRLTAADTRFTVVVNLENPNDRAIAVEAIDAELRIENVPVGTARLASPVQLPARGETMASLVVQSDLAASLRAAAEIAQRFANTRDAAPAIRYAVSGAAVIDGGNVVPFSRSGEFPLRSGATSAN